MSRIEGSETNEELNYVPYEVGVYARLQAHNLKLFNGFTNRRCDSQRGIVEITEQKGKIAYANCLNQDCFYTERIEAGSEY